MKTTMIALVTAFALSGTAAMAQGTTVTSVGTVTAPSIGSYYWPSVGTTNRVPTWNNTMPAERGAPSAHAFGGRARF
jgi:hypothetical protein